MEQYTPNVGRVPDDMARRDAIHVPMLPFTAAELLMSGEHVGITPDGRASKFAIPHVGYVDPELPRYGSVEVHPGGRFWLWLYQGTVTSLRHVWRHPAFAPRLHEGKTDE